MTLHSTSPVLRLDPDTRIFEIFEFFEIELKKVNKIFKNLMNLSL